MEIGLLAIGVPLLYKAFPEMVRFSPGLRMVLDRVREMLMDWLVEDWYGEEREGEEKWEEGNSKFEFELFILLKKLRERERE